MSSHTPWHRHFPRSHKTRRTRGEKTFASLAETRRYDELLLLEKAGEIRNLRTQVAFPLQTPDGSVVVRTPTGRVAHYTADFVYEELFLTTNDDNTEHWREVIEDVKGIVDRIAELRISVFEALSGRRVFITGKAKRITKKKKRFLP